MARRQTPGRAARLLALTVAAGPLALGASSATAQSSTPLVQNPVLTGHEIDHVALGFGAAWGAGDRRLVQVDRTALRVLRSSPRFPTAATDLAAGSTALWVRTRTALWRVDPQTLQRTRVANVSRAGRIAVREQRVWYSADGRRTVRRLDDGGAAPQGPAAVLPGPAGAMVLRADALWVAERGGGQVWKLDPATGALLATFQLRPAGAQKGRIVHLTANATTLFAAIQTNSDDDVGCASLVGLDIATGTVASRRAEPPGVCREFTGDTDVAGLAAADGSVWYARVELNSEAGGAVGPSGVLRYDVAAMTYPGGAANRATRELLDGQEGANPRDLAATASEVWVANGAGLVRLGGTGPQVANTTRVPGIQDVAVARNRVWVLTRSGLRRIDARTGRPVGPVRRFRGRYALTAANGWLWLVSRNARLVRRIDPRSGRVRGATRLPRARNETVLAFPSWGIVRWARDDIRRRAALGPELFPSLSGYSQNGRRRFRRQLPQDFDFTDGVPAFAAYRGEVWGAGNGGIARFDRRGRRRANVRAGDLEADAGAPSQLTVDRTHAWVANRDGGLLQAAKRGRRVSRIVLPWADRVATDSRSAWVLDGVVGSLHRFDRRTLREMTPALSAPKSIGSELASGAGYAWIAPYGRDRLARIKAR